MTLEGVFGVDGLFSKAFDGYERREGQVELAQAIEKAIFDRSHLVAEGPCGTGKGVAYLVPAIMHVASKGRRVIVATANIALQEQLVTKDLPMLARLMPEKFTFALLKGRNNYACVDATTTAEQTGALARHPQGRRFLEWYSATQSGDQSEMAFKPDADLWSMVSVMSEKCKGNECMHSYHCFAEKAIEAAKAANIVVTNYHLLFANAAVRAETGKNIVLPDHDVLICDEAHEMSEIARDFFGFQVSQRGVEAIARALGDKGEQLADKAKRFFSALSRYAKEGDYKRRLKRQDPVGCEKLAELLDEAASEFQAKANNESANVDVRHMARLRAKEATNAKNRIGEAMALADVDKVYWIDAQPGGTKLCGKPIFVGERLRDEIFEKTPTVVLTSATMTIGAGDFSFIRRECGVPEEAREIVAASPFDFREQAICIMPKISEPSAPTYQRELSEVVAKTIEFAGGRTLGLFTSYRSMQNTHAAVSSRCKHRILMQGNDRARTDIAMQFRDEVETCLFGVESFWTGVDVVGESLSVVLIDKFPFPHPDDPVIDAISEKDRNAFMNYMVPKALMQFRQGVGRLIRSKTDRGVVVVCDSRIETKQYGKQFIRSLPKGMRTSKSLDDIKRFLG